MKRYFYIPVLIFTILLAACTFGNRIPKTGADKDLFSVLKKLDKDPSNTELKNSLGGLYNSAAKSHLDQIESYRIQAGPERWIKIVKEYEALKNLSETIVGSTAATLINPPPYITEWQNAKQSAAEEYYKNGLAFLDIGDKPSARNAYVAFKKSNEFIPGYQDVTRQMGIAYQNSIINVVINPVRDNTFFYNSMGWNNYGDNYNNDYFQRSLVNDLGGSNNRTSPALFYTDREARRENIQPDWEVNLTWQYLNMPPPTTSQYSRTVTKSIEAGTDTSGKTKFQTVTATLNIVKKHFTASGDLELQINDVVSGKNITTNRYSEQFSWQAEYANYTGDSRALGANEYSLLNNNHYRVPRNEDILNELSRKVYPNIKNRIATVANW